MARSGLLKTLSIKSEFSFLISSLSFSHSIILFWNFFYLSRSVSLHFSCIASFLNSLRIASTEISDIIYSLSITVFFLVNMLSMS